MMLLASFCGPTANGSEISYRWWFLVFLAQVISYVATVEGVSEDLDKSSLESAADFAKEMDMESARLRQFPSPVHQHHALKKSVGQTDPTSYRDKPHDEVTPPPQSLNTSPAPKNGTRSGITLHVRPATAKWSPTRRNIYIRGHLLSHLDNTRKINSSSLSRGGAVIHRPSADGVWKDGIPERYVIDDDERNVEQDGRFNLSSAAMGRRYFVAQGQQLHNYKFLRGNPTQSGSEAAAASGRGGPAALKSAESQYSALLNSVGALLASATVTVTLCLVIGLSRHRIKTGVNKICWRRDRQGDYERVDSVSSLVDSSASSQLDVYLDDPHHVEDISII